MLLVNNLSKKYTEKFALDNVSFEIKKGSIFGLLGPNGAGKTTLIRIINKIIYPDAGEILFNGDPLTEKHLRNIGYLPEERGLYKKMKVKEQLSYFASLRNFENARKEIPIWLEKFDLLEWENKKIEELSKGMQQKVQFINAVLHRPELIILDEPFSGFDPVNVSLVINEIRRLREEGSTILYSTHRMESVEELCDDLMMINKAKKVVEGSVYEVKNQYKNNQWKVGTDKELQIDSSYANVDFLRQENKVFYYLLTPINQDNTWKNELVKNNNLVHLQENLPSINEIFIKHAN